jgi:hypothetical protein
MLFFLLGACAVIGGCGDSGSGGSIATGADNGGAASAGLTSFLGSWAFKTGTQTLTCDGTDSTSSMPEDRFTITAGPVPETIVVDDDGCVLTYNVTETLASSPLGGTCDGEVVETSLEVSPGGLLHFSGVSGVELDGGNCTVTIDGYLARR